MPDGRTGTTRLGVLPLDEILEKDWMRTVVDLATQTGWTTYHTYNSRRSAHGFPDLVLVRDRIIYLELKRENRTTSRLTDDQISWLRALQNAGGEIYVARPSDLRHLATILTSRHYAQYRTPLGQQLEQELDRQPRQKGAAA